MQRNYRSIKPSQQLSTCLCEVGPHDPSVFGAVLPLDPVFPLQPIHQPGDIGAWVGHLLADLRNGQAIRAAAPQRAEDIVLLAGKAVLTEQVRQLDAEDFSGADQVQVGLLLRHWVAGFLDHKGWRLEALHQDLRRVERIIYSLTTNIVVTMCLLRPRWFCQRSAAQRDTETRTQTMVTHFLGRGATVKREARALAIAASLALASPALAQAPPDFSVLRATPFDPLGESASAEAHRTMIAIPAGPYPIGRSSGHSDQQPQHTVALAAFRIDRTEVTNAAFAEYLNALGLSVSGSFGVGGLTSAVGPSSVLALLREGREGSGAYPIIALDDDQVRIELRHGRFAPSLGFEDHPVAETTWAGARAYCAWRNARLPTEAEWEAAARGSDDRLYPWGDAPPDGARAFVSGRSGVTASVGGRPGGASPFGVLDMAGSLAEWTSSLRRPFPYIGADGRESPTTAGERVTRGGDYVYDRSARTLTVSHRNGFSNAPERGHRHIGFRCAAP